MIVSYEYDSIQKTIDGYNEVIKKWSDTGKISESQRKEFTSILNNIEEEYKKYSEIIPEYAKKVNEFTVEIAKETKTMYDKSIVVMKSYINRFITIIEECKNESLVAKAALDKRKSDKIIFDDLQPKYYLGSQTIQKPEGVKITNVEGTTVSTTNSGFNYRKPTGNFWVVSPMGCNQNAEYVVAFIKIEYEFCANIVPSNQDPVTEKTYEYRLMMMRPNENVWVDAPTDILDPDNENRWIGNFNMPVYGEYEYTDVFNSDSPGPGFCIGSLPHYNNNIDDIYWNEVAFKTTDSDSILMIVFNGSKVDALNLYLLDLESKCWFCIDSLTEGLIPTMIHENWKAINNRTSINSFIPVLIAGRGNKLIDGSSDSDGFAIDVVKVRNGRDDTKYVFYMSYGFYSHRRRIRKGITYTNEYISNIGEINKCKIILFAYTVNKNTKSFNVIRNNNHDSLKLFDLSYNDFSDFPSSSYTHYYLGFLGWFTGTSNFCLFTGSCFFAPSVTSHVVTKDDGNTIINVITFSYNCVNDSRDHTDDFLKAFDGMSGQTVTKQYMVFHHTLDVTSGNNTFDMKCRWTGGEYVSFNNNTSTLSISDIILNVGTVYGNCINPLHYRQNIMFTVDQMLNNTVTNDSSGHINIDTVKSSVITNYQPIMSVLSNTNDVVHLNKPKFAFIPSSNSWVNINDYPTLSSQEKINGSVADTKNGGFHLTDVNPNSQLYGKRFYDFHPTDSMYNDINPNPISFTISGLRGLNENICFGADERSIASAGGFGSVLVPAIVRDTDDTNKDVYLSLYYIDEILCATSRVKSKRSQGYFIGGPNDDDPYMIKSKMVNIGNDTVRKVKDILVRFRVEGGRRKNDIVNNFVANKYGYLVKIYGDGKYLNSSKFNNTFTDITDDTITDVTVDKYNKRNIYREEIEPNAIVHLELLYTTPDGLSKVIEVGKKGSFIDSGGTMVCEESLFYNITKLFGENEDTNLDNGELTTFTTYSGIEYDDSEAYDLDMTSATIRYTKSLTQSEYYDKDDKISNVGQAIGFLFLPVPNFTGFNENNTISFDIVCKLNAFGDTFFSTRKCFLNVPNMKDSRTCSFEIKLKDLQDYMDAAKFIYGMRIDPLGFVKNNIRPRLYVKKITVSDKEWLGLFLFAFDNDGKSINISSKSVYEPLSSNELVGKSMTTVYNNVSSSLIDDKLVLSRDRVPSNVNRTKFNINSGKKEFCSGFNGYSLEIENLLIPFGTQNGDSLDYYSSFNMTDIPTDPVTGTGPDISIDFENDFYVNVFGYNETSDDQGNAVFRFDI